MSKSMVWRPGVVLAAAGVVAAMWWAMPLRATGFSQPEPPRNARIARVDVYTISERIMQSPETLAAIEAVANQWREKLKPIQEDLNKLGAQLQTLPENDPTFEKLLAEGREKEAQGRQLEAQANAEVESTKAKLLIEAYSKIVAEAERLASAKGYTHVMGARSATKPIETDSVNIALQEMLARTVIVGPSEDDLTEQVAKALNAMEAPAGSGVTPETVPGSSPGSAPMPLPVQPK
jgi:Skp family chaperone for outer membrane proteins